MLHRILKASFERNGVPAEKETDSSQSMEKAGAGSQGGELRFLIYSWGYGQMHMVLGTGAILWEHWAGDHLL